MQWLCPHCAAVLLPAGTSLRCANNHTYDKAREGYVNLLLANQKRRPEPGDNQAMLNARAAFLNAGLYGPLLQALLQAIPENASGQLLDLGCGEGYYLDGIARARPGLACAGLDISRAAIKLCARRGAHLALAVASAVRLPVAEHSLDWALSVFAPLDAGQLRGKLNTAGRLLVVSPGPSHLLALKQRIYQDARLHPPARAPEGFVLVQEQAVQFPLQLAGPGQLDQLLAMTPFHYRITDSLRAQLLAEPEFSVQADFRVRLYEVAP